VSPDFSACFFKSFSGTRASPPGLLDNGDEDTDDQRTVQEEVSAS
jgi:hypothetical protein